MDAGPGFEPGMLRAYETRVVAALPAVNSTDFFQVFSTHSAFLNINQSRDNWMSVL